MVPFGTSATEWPIVPAPGDYDDGEFGGMNIGWGNRSTRRKPAPGPLCPQQIPLDQTRVWIPGLRGGKPATNRLSYGAASLEEKVQISGSHYEASRPKGVLEGCPGGPWAKLLCYFTAYSVIQSVPFKKQPKLQQYMQTYREEECNKTNELLVFIVYLCELT
jgi:hypothetical protein